MVVVNQNGCLYSWGACLLWVPNLLILWYYMNMMNTVTRVALEKCFLIAKNHATIFFTSLVEIKVTKKFSK